MGEKFTQKWGGKEFKKFIIYFNLQCYKGKFSKRKNHSRSTSRCNHKSYFINWLTWFFFHAEAFLGCLWATLLSLFIHFRFLNIEQQNDFLIHHVLSISTTFHNSIKFCKHSVLIYRLWLNTMLCYKVTDRNYLMDIDLRKKK